MTDKKENSFFIRLLGGAIGLFIGYYFIWIVIYPAIGAFITHYFLKKIRLPRQDFLWVLTAVGAQIFWVGGALIVLGLNLINMQEFAEFDIGKWDGLLDVLLLATAFFWILKRLSVLSLIFLICIEMLRILGATTILYEALEKYFSFSMIVRGSIVNICICLATIIVGIVSIWRSRKEKTSLNKSADYQHNE